jgi:hypothetical protein
MSILHFDDIMPEIWSCQWIQSSVRETIVSSYDLVPTLMQIIVCMMCSLGKFCYVKYNAPNDIFTFTCSTSSTWYASNEKMIVNNWSHAYVVSHMWPSYILISIVSLLI